MRRSTAGTIAAIILFTLFVWGADAPSPVLVFNEIAWSGAAWDHTAEWIELFNTTDEAIELAGWRLVSSDGSPDIPLRGTVFPANAEDPTAGYVLLERDDDRSVPDVPADFVYRGALADHGETLFLCDPAGVLIDSANLPLKSEEGPAGWPAGTAEGEFPAYATMERVNPYTLDLPDNWETWHGSSDPSSGSLAVHGSPKRENSTFNILSAAAMLLTPSLPKSGDPVVFEAVSAVDAADLILSFFWVFGDGGHASGQTASHTYVHPGEYEVILTVTDKKGNFSQAVQTLSVLMATTPPIVDFSILSPDPRDAYRTGDLLVFQDESSAIEGNIISWEWDFGDGGSAQGNRVLYSYDRPGDYTVAFRILDEKGGSSVQTQPVTIMSRPPVAVFTMEPDRPTEGVPVRFDASSSWDPDSKIQSYEWDFDGDRVVDVQTPDSVVEYTFSRGGDYAVNLCVVDEYGERALDLVRRVTVNLAPLAQFRLSTFEPWELEEVVFTDCSFDEDGTIVRRQWDFGDGATSEETSPTHVYREGGAFVASLTVTDDVGAMDTTSVEIQVADLLPVARLSVGSSSLMTSELFQFDASSSSDPSPRGAITCYDWDYDNDGEYDEMTTQGTVSHAYEDDGHFTVRVRVTDNAGGTAVSAPIELTVLNRPPQVEEITWIPEQPEDGEIVSFSGKAHDPDGSVVAWCWDFGEETLLTGSNPSYLFPDDGLYVVHVTATDDDGARSAPFPVSVSVKNAPPEVVFSVAFRDPRTVVFDARDSFDPSPSGTIAHVAWDFGDGSTCPGASGGCDGTNRFTPVHVYAEPGTYTVTLVLADEEGGLSRSRKTIHIAD